jgi:SulP family sulfate permease
VKQLRYAPRADAAVLVLVLVFTVFFDLIQAVALGLALASLLFMKRMGDESSDRSEVGTMDELMREPKDPEERELHNMFKGKVHVHKLHGPLHFGFTSTLQDMAASIPDTPHVLIRMREVPFMDQSGLNTVMEIIQDLSDKGTKVYITGLQRQPAQLLKDLHVAPGIVPKEHILNGFRELLPIVAQYEGNSEGPPVKGNTQKEEPK